MGTQHEIAAGLRSSLAVGLGLFPIGVAFGLLVIQAGLPWWLAPALSIAVFAGSMELLLVGLISSVTPLATIALTTLLVNFRHIFYPLSFPAHVVKNPILRTYSIYAMIDEAYAVTAVQPKGWTQPRLIALQVALQCYWVAGGLVGVAVGELLPMQIEGLDFALCALFVTLTLDAARSWDEVPSVVLAGLSFLIAVVTVPGQALFAAMVIFVGVLLVRYVQRRGQHART